MQSHLPHREVSKCRSFIAANSGAHIEPRGKGLIAVSINQIYFDLASFIFSIITYFHYFHLPPISFTTCSFFKQKE
uniref:Uncharacterized protein n=1 Tax=Oncorhynchus tshawytscha TaxID=74940 RepID=A0A8C8LRE2_ONCTS